MNDVNFMALAENIFGKSRDIDNFILLNLGTGIRPLFVVNDVVIEGSGGNCGEISQKEIFVSEIGNRMIK